MILRWTLFFYWMRVSAGETVSTCLSDVVQLYFPEKSVYMVLQSTSAKKSLEDAFRNIYEKEVLRGSKTILLANDLYRATLKTVWGCDLLIFIEDIPNSIKNGKFFKNAFRNCRGRAVLVADVAETLTDPEDPARNLLRAVWKLTKQVNVVVMIIGSSSMKFYTWFPYRRTDCGDVKTISYLDEWVNGTFVEKTNLFPKKISKNLNGCELVASGLVIPPFVIGLSAQQKFVDGYEIRAMDFLADVHQFSLKFHKFANVSQFWASSNTDGYGEGVFRLFINQEIDIAFGSIMGRADRFQWGDALSPHFFQTLEWYAPIRQGVFSYAKGVFSVFSPEALFFLTWFNIINVFVFYLIANSEGRRHEESREYQNFLSGYLTSWALFFNTAHSRPKTQLLRFAVFLFLIYALHVSAAYQSSLIEMLTRTDSDIYYETVQEMLDDELICYLPPSLRAFFNQTDHSLWNQILAPGKFRYFGYGESGQILPFDEIAYNRTGFVLYPRINAEYMVEGKYRDQRGQLLIRSLPDPYTFYITCFYLSPGHPLHSMLDRTMLKIREGGFMSFWKKMVNLQNSLETHSQPPDDLSFDSEEPFTVQQALSLIQLESIFFLYAVSVSVDIIVFFGELTFYHLIQKKLGFLLKIGFSIEPLRIKKRADAKVPLEHFKSVPGILRKRNLRHLEA